LSAKRQGYAPQQYKEHESYTSAIVTGPGHDAENIRFALMPAATISGVVTDETGEAVRGAQVSLRVKVLREGKSISGMSAVAVTDDEGRYRFAHLSAGTYLVEATGEPWYANHEMSGGFAAALNPAEIDRGRMSDPEYVQSLLTKRLAREKASASRNPDLDVIYPRTFYANAHSAEEATPIRVNAGDNAISDVALHSIPALHVRVQI
jgi:protocatechuate 3,4-dioxygenase beta subunit